MVYKIRWTRPAIADLGSIGDYIAKEDPQAAIKVGQALIDHVQILAGFPHIGTPFPRHGHGRAREILCLNYRIFYRIQAKQQEVEILRIWHGARDEPKGKDLHI
ncbi:type II toxin-antitoxin system RelE/ParE family toxin [Puniceicoccales bacterium CK1056]|uniref:Type II toxin-antitoxin system RelE/ParE family toxin n=1 Tax=Oceanipulchritudo coccoides TaxID=2706888 RepID=A0A6B2M4U4_9BACT|nr:type II toxin-antitoxin system RelE/ParE family toxin [Oceanipulchritudo coccoides]NDV63376.1 type II toxin-antitoxin system RelE/ParE family toxin [Oceanipulchritudo coccoides]